MNCARLDHSNKVRRSQHFRLPLAAVTRLIVGQCALLIVMLTFNPTCVHGQLAKLRSRINNRPTVFTGSTRQLLRPLRLAESAIETQDYDQACLLLGAMLDDDELKDCLVPDAQEWGYAISLRQKAVNLLGTMTEDQRSAYREKYATRSAQLLEKAIEARDYRQIEFVSERCLYTDAGLEATMLLGHHWLNSGRPEMSAGAFEKLIAIPRGEKLYDPELSLLSAISLALSQRQDSAVEQLKRLKEMNVKEVTFFNRQVSIYSDDQSPLDWLVSLIGDSPLSSNAIVSQWLMWQGNPQRNAQTGPGLPLFSPRWSTETLGEYQSTRAFENWLDAMAKNQVAPVPKTNLLTIGDTIVVRTAEKMVGIDAATGKRRWSFPATNVGMNGSYLGVEQPAPVALESVEFGTKVKTDQARQAKFYERIVQDAVFSQIASDGKLVFCIPNPGVATIENDWLKYRSDRFEAPTDLRKYNELCGIDVGAEGALVWQVGGLSGGDESKLARTFFLGAPLPLDGSLYCVCVQDELVKLAVLDAKTGSLQWDKELASTEEAVDFTHDVVRRLAGASPSASDGVVVCPTGLNALVAVDIGTRSLKWGFQLSQPEVMPYSRRSALKGRFWKAYENVWRDTSLKISDGAVIYTAIDSKELCCIDLKTGRSRWGTARRKPKTLRRSSEMYAAAVKNGEIILVAPGELRGVSLARGEIAWTIPFETHGTVSGQGYTHGSSYYLPTTSKKLLRFDLVNKSISKVVDTERVLGNLYPWKADIVSVGIDHVAAYPCDITSQRIFEMAEANGEAPSSVSLKPHAQLAIRAQLQLQQGDFPEAARLISAAYDLFPNSSYAGVLVEVLTELIRVDFKHAEAMFARYKDLFEPRDLQQLLRGKVNGLVKSQRYREAFETLLEIADGIEFGNPDRISPGDSIPVGEVVQLSTNNIDLSPAMSSTEQNGVVEISRTAFLRWQLSQLANRMLAESEMKTENKPSKEDLLSWVEKHLTPYREQDSLAFFQRLQLFPSKLIRPALAVAAASRLLKDERRIEAKSLLGDEWTDADASPEINAQRLQILAVIAIDQQDTGLVNGFVERLREKEEDGLLQSVVQGVASLEEGLRKNAYDDRLYLKLAKEKSVLRGPRYELDGVQWKRNVSKIGEGEYVPFGDGRHRCLVYETDVEEIHKLSFLYETNHGELQIYDSLGRQVRSVYLRPNGDADSFSSGTTGKIFLNDSVVLFCIGKEMVAMDWIRMVRGEDPVMWTIRLEQGTSSRNVFGGPRSSGVCYLDGSELKCVDLFTGQTRWVRNRIPHPSMVKEGGDQVTIWNDNRHIYETFDKLSGRRVAGGKVSKMIGSTSTGHNNLHLFQTPLRNKPMAEAGKKSERNTPDDPFADQPYTDLKLQLFDFETGETVWERVFPFPTVFRRVDQQTIAVLTREGVLSMLDLSTGEVRFEKQVQGLSGIACLQLAVHPQAQGYICVVNTSEGHDSKVKQGDGVVQFFRVKGRGWLNTGYVFAVDKMTGESLWDNPVRVESFGWLDGTPYNSPFLMLIRRANYRSQVVGANRAAGSKPRIQVAMLDVETGRLKSNYLFNVAVGNEPRCQLVCRPGREYQGDIDEPSERNGVDNDGGNQRLELLLASQRFTIELSDSDSESDDADPAPAILSNEASAMKLEDAPDEIAKKAESNLVVDLAPLAQRAQEAYDEMVELGKVEAELFEKQRRSRAEQR